jgi:carbon-monoxide dehydrogenase medium subunit
MFSMELHQPESLEESFSLLDRYGDDAKVIAGGTALGIMLRNRLIFPDAMVSLGRIQGLNYIRHEPGVGLRFGALTTIRQAEMSPLLREMNPALAQTFGEVGNVRVRHAATVGGNLGEADYASDPPCVLVALRGYVRVVSSRGEREIPLTEFFHGYYETSLEPDEVLTELVVPDLPPLTGVSYIKYVTRSTEDRPCVGVAAYVQRAPDGSCTDLRVVLGAVTDTPQEFSSAEGLATGQHLSDELIAEVAEAYADAIDPLSDLRGSAWYRKEVTRVLIRRAVRQAMAV